MGIHLGLCRRRAAVTPSSPGQLPGGGVGAGNARPRHRASSLPDEAREQRRGLTGRVQELRGAGGCPQLPLSSSLRIQHRDDTSAHFTGGNVS